MKPALKSGRSKGEALEEIKRKLGCVTLSGEKNKVAEKGEKEGSEKDWRAHQKRKVRKKSVTQFLERQWQGFIGEAIGKV